MAAIRDYAVTIYAAVTANMVCEMPTHEAGDLLVAFVNKDTNTAFTKPARWTTLQVQASAGANGGIYILRATSSAEQVTFPLASETCCGVVLSVKGTFLSTGSAISVSTKTAADDSTLPLAGAIITPSHSNCLLLHGLSTDSGIGANALPPWVNIFAGDTGQNTLCVSYSHQKQAALVTGPNHWAGAADDSRAFLVAIRDNGSGSYFDPYIPLSTTPATQISPLNGTTGVVDKGAYVVSASAAIRKIGSKRSLGVTVGSTVDSGINPFRGSMVTAGRSSTTDLAHTELNLTTTVSLTGSKGLVFGTYRNTAPRDFIDTGTAVRGGKYILIGSSPLDTRTWVVGGQFTKTEVADARNNYLIDVTNTSTTYATSGSADMGYADYFAFGSSGYYGAPSVTWNELYLMNDVNIAGGSSTNPIDFDDVVYTVNNGCGIIPLMQQAGSSATVWCPLTFGGVEPLYIDCDLNTFQFPRLADEIDYVDFHVPNNKVGIEFYASGSNNLLTFTNCVFTSPSSYYWKFNQLHSSASSIDFSGTTVVNAAVDLKSQVVLSGTKFINGTSFNQSSSYLSDCSFLNTKVTSDKPNRITNSTFTTGSTLQSAIEITTPGSYTFTGNTFFGYGANNTSGSVLLNRSGGQVTMSIVEGDTPTYRNVAAATTLIINNIAVTLTGMYDGTEVRVYATGTTTELAGIEEATDGTVNDRSFTFSLSAGTIVDIAIHSINYEHIRLTEYEVPSSTSSVPIQQRFDRNYAT